MQLSSNDCYICFLGDGVEIAEEEEQAESWAEGEYKCAGSVEMFWYCCEGTHAECCGTVIIDVHSSAG